MTLESPDNRLSHLSLAVPTPLMPPAKCLFKFAKLTALRYSVILHGDGYSSSVSLIRESKVVV